MVLPSVGDVVVLPFPFSDLSGSKQRPALVLADAGRRDWILCQIASRRYADPRAVELTADAFSQGSLGLVSYARPGKPFTANGAIIIRRAGALTPLPFRGYSNQW